MEIDFVAIGDLLLGLLAISLQISTYALYGNTYTPDMVSVGIWGGIILLATAVMTAMKNKVPKMGIKGAATASVVVGAVMIGIYSWQMDNILWWIYESPEAALFNGSCKYKIELNLATATNSFCDEMTIASLFIVDGILAILLNVLLFFKA